MTSTSNANKAVNSAQEYDLQTGYFSKPGSSKDIINNDRRKSDNNSSDSDDVIPATPVSVTKPKSSVKKKRKRSARRIIDPQSFDFNETILFDDMGDFDDQYISLTNDSMPMEWNEFSHSKLLEPVKKPPDLMAITETLAQFNLPLVQVKNVHYKNPEDAKTRVEVGSKVIKIPNLTTDSCGDFQTSVSDLSIEKARQLKLAEITLSQNLDGIVHVDNRNKRVLLQTAKLPPSSFEVQVWLNAKNSVQSEVKNTNSDDECPTEITRLEMSSDEEDANVQRILQQSAFQRALTNSMSNQSCAISGDVKKKVGVEGLQKSHARVRCENLTVLTMEVHVETRDGFHPNPSLDAIRALFYMVFNDNGNCNLNKFGIITTRDLVNASDHIQMTRVQNERELIQMFINLINDIDPDLFMAYELEKPSYAYVIERSFVLNIEVIKYLSRVHNDVKRGEQFRMCEFNPIGRAFLEVWRLLRHEIALYSYSFENTVYHVLNIRVPKHSHEQLTKWFNSSRSHLTVAYYKLRIDITLKLVTHLDLINRTCELARLFGIQFLEVLTRGSQFRVESLMLRLSRPLDYIPLSLSVAQRARMHAPEYVPLILEPESRLYDDPVIVLDFQSLYPSMIIGYNYCFSTCLGKIENMTGNPFQFGGAFLKLKARDIKRMIENGQIHISPCGVAFVKSRVRDGVLPRMLREILECRLMVKQSMKQNKGDETLQKVLHSRQLGLKLIANVTYGYTAANFSGRMPAVEVADSVVSKGRETLERAIKMVECNEKWRARVVYGDTDSLFVLVPGRSRTDAFKIGAEIAEAVTNKNPHPVKLKLEKVYQPCILLTKKRYVGYLYETPEQQIPDFDAKGIETVRRDGCPAVAKILERSLRILFESKDMSRVKQYVCNQFVKILANRVNIQDLFFTRQYRGLNGYKPTASVPALEIVKKQITRDFRSEPSRKERVAYVITNGPPGSNLTKLAETPRQMLEDSSLTPHAIYYITKVIIPPLNRCLLLCGADVHEWFKDLPRKDYVHFFQAHQERQRTLYRHFQTKACVACGKQTFDTTGLCEECVTKNRTNTCIVLNEKARKWERAYRQTQLICQSCCGRVSDTECVAYDCPVLYRIEQLRRDFQQVAFVRQLLDQF